MRFVLTTISFDSYVETMDSARIVVVTMACGIHSKDIREYDVLRRCLRIGDHSQVTRLITGVLTD